MIDIEVAPMKMESHMSMSDCGILIRSCEIKNEFHILKGKKIIIETYTPKIDGVFGKGETTFYLEGSKKAYKTLNGFLKSNGFNTIKP